MKKVIYTILVGNYDQLMQPRVIDDGFDYVCFSNEISTSNVGVWKIRKIAYQDGDKTRVSRFPKLLPHKVLQDYDYSIYMDANIQITGPDFYQCANRSIEEGVLVSQVSNIFRDCIYKDMEIAFRLGKVDFRGTRIQYNHLKQEGFPEHFGLFENNVILRKHNEPIVIGLSEAWWAEYCAYTHRDQFSLMYVYWKNHFMPSMLLEPGKNARNVDFLHYMPHPKKPSLMRLLGLQGIFDNCQSYLRKQVWNLFIRKYDSGADVCL